MNPAIITAAVRYKVRCLHHETCLRAQHGCLHAVEHYPDGGCSPERHNLGLDHDMMPMDCKCRSVRR